MASTDGCSSGGESFGDGLFSSSLDGYKQVNPPGVGVCQCKSPHCPRVHYLNEDGTHGPWEVPVPTAVETSFRHSGWSVDRERVFTALRSANVSPSRLNRFASCGAAAYVEWSPDEGRHRVRGFFCGDRFCKPCSRSRSARGRRAILTLAEGKFLRFVTLTRRSSEESVIDALDHLLSSFKRLRKSDIWSACVKGGAGVVEVKEGAGSGGWHVHLHLLVHGYFIDQRRLSHAWHVATGDSFIVDVRAVKDEEHGAAYVCKYLGKGFDQSVLACSARLRECVDGLSGRRMLVTFGDWYNRVRDDEDGSTGEWRVVGSLHGVIAAAERGEEWARGVLLSLRARRQRLAEDEGPPSPENST